jgi:beta-1,4-mannosyltransferase
VSAITTIPDRDPGYVHHVLLYGAMESAGIRYVQIPFSLRYLLRHGPAERYHYVHFHWPEIFFVIRPRQPHRLFGMKGFLKLHAFWLLAKWRGYKLVWTVHEVDVHDLERHRWIHAASRRLLWRQSAVVFTHSRAVRDEAVRRWGPKRHLYIVPHGSYVGGYPDTVTRDEARQRLGLPDRAQVFVFLGNLRPYKGVDLLIEAFRSLHAEFPDAWLVVCGRAERESFGAHVREAMRGLPNARLVEGFVPDADVQLYLRAADCFVAPYRRVETSGIVYLSLAFDLPVIVTAQGSAAELEPLGVGIFMRDPAETGSAMRRFLEMPEAERATLREAVRRAAHLQSWDAIGHQYRAALAAFETESLRRRFIPA